MDPSHSSLQSSEAESVLIIGFYNRFQIGIQHTIGSEPGSLRFGNIREDQSVLSLKLPESPEQVQQDKYLKPNRLGFKTD